MTEQELREFLIAHYPVENEKCDWKEMKNLKNSFNGHEGEDVMSYVSGIANMEGGVLVIGVKDKTLEIVGTDLSQFNLDTSSAVYKIKRTAQTSRQRGCTLTNTAQAILRKWCGSFIYRNICLVDLCMRTRRRGNVLRTIWCH